MNLAGCTTRVAVCDDTGFSGGLTVLPALPQVMAVLAVLLVCALLVRRLVHRRRQAGRPAPRRVWVSADGSVVEGPGLTATDPT